MRSLRIGRLDGLCFLALEEPAGRGGTWRAAVTCLGVLPVPGVAHVGIATLGKPQKPLCQTWLLAIPDCAGCAWINELRAPNAS